MLDSDPIGWVFESTTRQTTARSTQWKEGDFLFRPVVIVSGEKQFLGMIEDVHMILNMEKDDKREKDLQWKTLKIRNLIQHIDERNEAPPRDCPTGGEKNQVSFAKKSDLEKFLPFADFPQKNYLGRLRTTDHLLPLDPKLLCFGNTAIIAGINHGKSTLARHLVSQLHLAGKRVLVIDPSGEWETKMKEVSSRLEGNAGKKLAIHCMKAQMDGNPTLAVEPVEQAFLDGKITIVDVSLPLKDELLPQRRNNQCKITEGIWKRLTNLALSRYQETLVEYAMNGCIVIDEAQNFVSQGSPTADMFEISTKMYRKFGLGHVFITTGLMSLSEGLQVQNFLIGRTATPADRKCLRDRLGEEVALAAEHTIGVGDRRSWIVFGVATPAPEVPWEIETLSDSDIKRIFSNSAPKP